MDKPPPRETHRGTIDVPGLGAVTVVYLDNGQRVIPVDDFERLMQWLAGTQVQAEPS